MSFLLNTFKYKAYHFLLFKLAFVEFSSSQVSLFGLTKSRFFLYLTGNSNSICCEFCDLTWAKRHSCLRLEHELQVLWILGSTKTERKWVLFQLSTLSKGSRAYLTISSSLYIRASLGATANTRIEILLSKWPLKGLTRVWVSFEFTCLLFSAKKTPLFHVYLTWNSNSIGCDFSTFQSFKKGQSF